MTSQLVYFSGGRSDDLTDYVLQQSHGSSSVTFQCRLPKAGLYKLQVQFVITLILLLCFVKRFVGKPVCTIVDSMHIDNCFKFQLSVSCYLTSLFVSRLLHASYLPVAQPPMSEL